jgi:hypothetical protein
MTMSAAAPNPGNNLLILAALGIGTYWMMSRRAVAAPAGATAPRQAAGPLSNVFGAIDAGVRWLSTLGGSPYQTNAPGTYDGRAAQPWDTTPFGPTGPQFNNPSAYVSGGTDGLAANPVNVDPYAAIMAGNYNYGGGY